MLKNLGYEIAAKKSLKDKQDSYVTDLTSLKEQLAYYIKKLDDILNYKDSEIKAVILAQDTDSPKVKKLKETLYNKLLKAKDSFSTQQGRLYENDRMPQKNVDALEDKFAKSRAGV